MQHDTFSQLVLEIIQLFPEQAEGRNSAYRLLKIWNSRVDQASPAVALYEVWWTHICAAVHAAIVPIDFHNLFQRPLSPSVQLTLLRSPEKHFGDRGRITKDEEILTKCLQEAVTELSARMGPLPAS